jgi:hypothetical protein
VVDVLHVAPTNRHDETGHGTGILWGDAQVDVVGHQHVCMQHGLLVLQCLHQPPQIRVTILLVEET